MSFKIPQKKLTAFDIIILIVVALITVASFIFVLNGSSGSTAAHIITAGSSFDVPLEKDAEYDIRSNGYKYRIIGSDGEIFVAEADCPDGICENTPAIGKKNGSIVCLPGKLIIECNKAGGERYDADVIVP